MLRGRNMGREYNVDMIRLEHVLDSWKIVRQDTIAAVQEFPADAMDFRPTPDVMTFREIARHILEASEGLTGLILAGDDNFATPDFRQKVMQNIRARAAGDAASLASELGESMERRSSELASKPAEFY